jgi:hypothetical protein
MDFLLLGFGVILMMGGLFLLCRGKKKKLNREDFNLFSHKINNTHTLDPAHALIESHKLFVAAIGKIYPEKKMTAAETVSQVSKMFKNEHDVWKFHHLRNRIAHETDMKVSFEQSHEARKAFIRALKSLTQK